MGSVVSYFFGWSDNGEIDPGTGLTAKQRTLVRDCWKTLEPTILEIGVEIMITLFKTYPEYQDAFPKFRGRDLTELAKDRVFHAHCLNIMGAFEQAVEYLHDPELCVAGLHMTGERHARRGQDEKPFELLEPLTNKIIKERLGYECTPELSKALDITLALVFKEIKYSIGEYNRGEAEKAGESTC